MQHLLRARAGAQRARAGAQRHAVSVALFVCVCFVCCLRLLRMCFATLLVFCLCFAMLSIGLASALPALCLCVAFATATPCPSSACRSLSPCKHAWRTPGRFGIPVLHVLVATFLKAGAHFACILYGHGIVVPGVSWRACAYRHGSHRASCRAQRRSPRRSSRRSPR